MCICRKYISNIDTCLSSSEFLFISFSSQSLPQKRRCGFQVKPQNHAFYKAGEVTVNVTGSVQHCDHTFCCVAYYLMNDSQPVVDALGKQTMSFIYFFLDC